MGPLKTYNYHYYSKFLHTFRRASFLIILYIARTHCVSNFKKLNTYMLQYKNINITYFRVINHTKHYLSSLNIIDSLNFFIFLMAGAQQAPNKKKIDRKKKSLTKRYVGIKTMTEKLYRCTVKYEKRI